MQVIVGKNRALRVKLKLNNRTAFLMGKKFGPWTVLSFDRYIKTGTAFPHRRAIWVCQCDCGNKQKLEHRQVIGNMWTLCTGCKTRTRTCTNSIQKPGDAGFNNLYTTYKFQSKNRGFEFKIGKDFFKNATSSNCYYCEAQPAQVSFLRNSLLTKDRVEYGAYLYNGLDRVDNSIGYIESNVVPCCSICNYLKRGLSSEKFISQIALILKTHNKRKKCS